MTVNIGCVVQAAEPPPMVTPFDMEKLDVAV
jgi:hypothetical protein